MSKKRRTKKRVKKGPPPRKKVTTKPKLTKERIILYAIGIIMILSMALGLVVSSLAGR
jgi:hypothetical protein